MAHLAIQGHATRGNEVIALLEMLGGVNSANYSGKESDRGYYIEKDRSICFIDSTVAHWDFREVSLEQFFERFPYKVGDKVKTMYRGYGEVYAMKWIDDEIQYRLDFGNNISGWYYANELQPVEAKESMGTITIDDFKANTKEWLIDKLKSMSKDNALQAICNIHDELHKSQYPKTYEECCEILRIGSYFEPEIRNATTEECYIFMKLMRLKRCRNAYWKIAGDWKPDWENPVHNKWFYANINKGNLRYESHLLVFPTAEIRDAFYENFKDLIKQCKELL